MEDTQVLGTQDTGEQSGGSEGQAGDSEFTALDYGEGSEKYITGVMDKFLQELEGDDDDEVEKPEVELEEPPQEEIEPQENPLEEEEKPAQTAEQNAYYAQMRREQQAAQRDAEMRQALQNSPDYQISQLLQQQYGMPPEQILWQLQQAQVHQEAEARGVSPQQIQWERQQQQTMTDQQQYMQVQQQYLEMQQTAMNMQTLLDRFARESQPILQQYPHLTPDDLTDAVIWGQMNNAVHLPLEVMVRSRHADKLYSVQQESAKQEALAQVSGRAATSPQPPRGKAQPGANALTAEEAHFAQMFGMTPERYNKWR